MAIRLRHERLKRGWSQTQLAARAGLHAQQVSGIETGMLRPYPAQLARLARVLNVPKEEADSLLDEVRGE